MVLKLDFEKAYDSVNWSFLCDVLIAKGFDSGYVHRIMQLVSGGYTAVSVNGPYLKNGKGLRQGDPISPLLFNFVADAFSCILNRVASLGHILPVWSNLLPAGISHLQYTDYTIIMVQNDDRCLANLLSSPLPRDVWPPY